MQVQQNGPSDSTSTHMSSPLIRGTQDTKQLGFRSPITSAQKKRFPKFKYNNENADSEQHNPFSGPTYLPISFNRGKMSPSPFTPIKIKEEYPFGDCTGNSKDYNMLAKPFESPFGASTKDLPLSPCVYNFTSPGALFMRCQPNNNLQNNAYSPFFDFNLGSPNFAKKHVTKLDFNNPSKFILKAYKDEVSIEHDEQTEPHKDVETRSFAFPPTYDDIPIQSTQLKFPAKKSIYGSSMIPSQARTNDGYSNRTTQDSTSRKEARFLSYTNHFEDDTDTNNPRTPSPTGNTKIKLESINSFSSQPKGFDTAKTKKAVESAEYNNSQNSTVKVNAGHGEEEEDPHNEEEYCATKVKKKVCCNCKKSRCLKLYCDCFGRGQPCARECNCLNCLNTEAHVKERQEAMMAVLERNPSAFKPKVDHTDTPEKVKDTDEQGRKRHMRGCNCKKSGCQKKYCECYQAGVKCTELCKCEHCKNMDSCCRIKRAQNYGFVNFGSQDSLTINLPFSEAKALKQYSKQARKHLEFVGSPEEDDNSSYYHSSRSHKMLTHPDPSFYSDLPVQKKRKMDPIVSEFTPKRTLVFVKEETRTPETPEEGQYIMHLQRDKKNGVANFRASYANTEKKKKMIKVEETSEYIPSPVRASLSGRRSKRTIKPFSQFNSEEYELRK